MLAAFGPVSCLGLRLTETLSALMASAAVHQLKNGNKTASPFTWGKGVAAEAVSLIISEKYRQTLIVKVAEDG